MHIDPKRRQRLVTLLARYQKPAPAAPAPINEELLALAAGELGPARRREVLAHLAGDGELTRRWVTLQRYQDQLLDLPAAPTRRSSSPRPLLWSLTGAVAAAVLAIVVLLPLRLQNDPAAELQTLMWPDTAQPLRWPLASKGLGSPPGPDAGEISAADKAAFAAAVAAVLAHAPAGRDWEALRQTYAERAGANACPERCPAEQRAAWLAGQWAGWARLACISDVPVAPSYLEALERVRKALPDAGAETTARNTLTAWCEQSDQLFERYE